MEEFRLTIRDMIILHLYRFDGIDPVKKFDLPYGLTQNGVANALGISRAHACVEFKKKQMGGLVNVTIGHPRNCKRNQNIYYLTPDGRKRAQTLLELCEENSVDVETLFVERPHAAKANRSPTTRQVKDMLQMAISCIEEKERTTTLGEEDAAMYEVFLILQEAQKILAYGKMVRQ
jgi:hypothetical protein